MIDSLNKIQSQKNLRNDILKKLLLIAVVSLAVFSVHDFYLDRIQVSIAEALVCLIGLCFFWRFDKWVKTNKVNLFSIIFSHIVFCLLTYVLFLDGFATSTHIWLTAVPMISYMLNGLNVGFKFSAFYLGLSAIVLIGGELLFRSTTTLNNMLDVIFLVTIVWVLSHFYETSNRLARKNLFLMATKDSLTNLNNRHAFYEYFAQHQNHKIGLVTLDLDFFKVINDTYGHAAGDYALIQIAEVLSPFESDDIQVFRMGGEEFSLLTVDLDANEVRTLANDIHASIRGRDYVFEGQVFELTASVGFVVSDGAPSHLEPLMKQADAYLYHAKAIGRNRVVYELPEDFEMAGAR